MTCSPSVLSIFYSETEALSLYLRGKDSSIFDEFDPSVSDIKGYLCLLKLLSYCGLEDRAVQSLKSDYGLSDKKAIELIEKIKVDENIKE